MSKTPIPTLLRRHVVERFHYRCSYCQTSERIVGASFTVDHILEALGGLTVLGHFNEIRIPRLPNKIMRRCGLLAARAAYTPMVRLQARTYWLLYALIAP